MGEGGFFYQAFVYLTAAVLSVPIAKRLGLGSVLGYLVRELAGMWKDRKAYLVRAREIIRSVERMIRSEVEQGRHPGVDAAWDTTGLINEYGKKEDSGPS